MDVWYRIIAEWVCPSTNYTMASVSFLVDVHLHCTYMLVACAGIILYIIFGLGRAIFVKCFTNSPSVKVTCPELFYCNAIERIMIRNKVKYTKITICSRRWPHASNGALCVGLTFLVTWNPLKTKHMRSYGFPKIHFHCSISITNKSYLERTVFWRILT